jgi:hypothetical protein
VARDGAPRTLLACIDRIEARLAAVADRPLPAALTDPDPESEERWEPAQVWAHISELIAYWSAEAGRIVAAQRDAPVPYGRVPTDAIRTDAIEERRRWSQAERWRAVRSDLDELRRFIRESPPAAFEAEGLHPTGAVRTVWYVLERSIVAHLEEHADQLERLAAAAESVPEAVGE